MMPENGGSSSVNCIPVRVVSPVIVRLLSLTLPWKRSQSVCSSGFSQPQSGRVKV